MNRSTKHVWQSAVVTLFVAFIAFAHLQAGDTLYWDPTGTHGSNGAGSGAWSTGSSPNWWLSGATNTTWTDTTGVDTAVFGGPTGTYNVDATGNNNFANSITFNSTGYTLSGGTITLAGTLPAITVNAAATIGSMLTTPGSSTILNINGTAPLNITSSLNNVAVAVNNPYTQVAGVTTLGADNAVQIAAGSVLGINGQIFINPDLAGNGYVTPVSGGGTLALQSTTSSISNPDIYANVASNSYWGVQVATPINLGSGARFIGGHAGNDDYGQYGDQGHGDLGLEGPLYGTASLTIQGLPQNSQFEVALGGDNSGWTGALNIVQGDVATINPKALNGNDVHFAPAAGTTAALYLYGQSLTIGSLSGTGAGTMLIRNGVREEAGWETQQDSILTINQAVNGTFGGVVSDGPDSYYSGSSGTYSFKLGIVKAGLATLALSGTSNYTGPTTVQAGVLSVTSLQPGGTPSSIGASTSDPQNLVLAGGVLQYTGTGGTTDRSFTLDASGGTIDASGTGPLAWTNATGTIAFSGVTSAGTPRTLTLSGASTAPNTWAMPIVDGSDAPTALVKSGPGTWVIPISLTYMGPTTVNRGILQFAGGSSLTGPLVVNGGQVVTSDGFTGTSGTVQQGTLQINGANTFSGGVVVAGGSALVNGTLTASSATVRAGVLQLNALSKVQSASALALQGGTLAVNNLPTAATQAATVATSIVVSTPSALSFETGATWDHTTPLLIANGSLTLNDAATINLNSNATLGIGTYQLMELVGGSVNGSLGSAGLKLGTLPPRIESTITTANQGVNEFIDLSITAFDSIKWTGAASSVWDTATLNWMTVNGHAATAYIQQPVGDSVLFDDSASHGTVNLAASLQPSQVVVNNNSLDYTITAGAPGIGIGGSTSLVKNGAGLLMLASDNTYTGGTVVNGGTLAIGDGATTGQGSIVGNVVLSQTGATPAVLEFNRPDNLVFSGAISGSGALVQAGSGTTTLLGSGTYSGATKITSGVLQIGNGGITGSIPLDNVTNNASLIFNRADSITLTSTVAGGGTTYVDGGTLQLGDGVTAGTINGKIVTNATLALDPPTDTFSASIAGSGNVQIIAPTLTLAGSSTYTGSTMIGANTVMLPNVVGLGSTTSNGAVVIDGGVLEYTGAAAGGSGVSAHNLSVGSGGATIKVDDPAKPLTLGGAFTGDGGMSYSGPGQLIVGSLSLGGPIDISGGTITALGVINAYQNSAIQIEAGATLQSAATLNVNVSENGDVGSVNYTGSGVIQLVGTGNGAASPDIYFGPDHSSNSYWGAAIDAGLTIDLGNKQRYINAKTGHNAVSRYYDTSYTDARISGNIVGTGGITFTAQAVYNGLWAELLLQGNNTFSGPLEVDRGSVFLDGPTTLSQSNSVTLSNSDSTYSNLFLLGNQVAISNLQSAGTTPTHTGIANGNPTMTGPDTVTNPAQLTVIETSNTTFAGTIADTLDDQYNGGSLVPGPLSVIKTGSATLSLSGTNTFTGGLTVLQGTLVLAGVQSFPDGSSLVIGVAPSGGAATPFSPVAQAANGAAFEPVPEPASWMLLIAGFAFGLAIRARLGLTKDGISNLSPER